MVRTLTAGAIAWKESAFQAWSVLVESDELNMRYSSGYSGPPFGEAWEHRLQDDALSELIQQCPPGGGLAATTSFSIRIIEDGIGQSPRNILSDVGQLEGADCTVSILPDGEPYVDKIVMFSGVIDQVRFPGRHAEILIVDPLYHQDVQYPQVLLPQGAIDPGNTTLTRAVATVYGSSARIPLAPMLLTNVTARTYGIANHPITTFGGGEPQIAIIRDPVAIVLTQADTGVATADLDSATITLTRSLLEIMFGSGEATLSIQREIGVGLPGLAIDGDPFTKAILPSNAETDIYGDGHAVLGIRATWAMPEGSDRLLIDLTKHAHHPNADGATFTEVTFRIINASGTVVRDNLWRQAFFHKGSSAANGRQFVTEIQGITIPSGQFGELFFETIHSGGLGGLDDVYNLWQLRLVLGAYVQSLDTPLFLAHPWEGRRDTPEGLFTTFADAIIERPPDVIASILALDLDQTVDMNSAMLARDSMSGGAGTDRWNFDGGIGAGWYQERESAVSFLDRLCKQSQTVLFYGQNGWVLHPYTIEWGSQLSITPRQIAWQAGTSSDTPMHQRIPAFEWYNGSVREVVNRFEIHYAYNPGSGGFSKLRYCNSGGTNSALVDAQDLVGLCTNSENRFGQTPPLIIYADFIYDDATADFLLSHYVRYFWSQRLYVALDLKDWIGLHLEVGDFITINYPDLPPRSEGAVYEVHEIRTDVLRGKQRLTASHLLSTLFDYFLIYDQNDVLWSWFFSTGESPDWTQGAPSTLGFAPVNIAITPIPSWLEITTDQTYYIYPSVTGVPIVDTSPPIKGVGYVGSPTLLAKSGRDLIYTVSGGRSLEVELAP